MFSAYFAIPYFFYFIRATRTLFMCSCYEINNRIGPRWDMASGGTHGGEPRFARAASNFIIVLQSF